MRIETPSQKLKSRDVAEIIIGSLVLAFPVAVTEEVWNLSMELSIARTIVISLSSLVFISVFVQTTYSHDFSFSSQKQPLARVLSVYGPEFWFLAGQARGGLPQDVGVREDRKTVTIFSITTVAVRTRPLTLSSRNLYPRPAKAELILLLFTNFVSLRFGESRLRSVRAS